MSWASWKAWCLYTCKASWESIVATLVMGSMESIMATHVPGIMASGHHLCRACLEAVIR